MVDPLPRAVEAIREGLLVIFPTETVYGLAGNALDPMAIDRVFTLKGRAPDRPISIAFPSIDGALEYVSASDREHAFMDEFLPGPVTVLLEHDGSIPSALTGGRARVGIRIPDHDIAIAFLEEIAPVTATSANRSRRPAAKTLDSVDASVRAGTAVHLDGGRTGGGASTVVNVETGSIVRPGRSRHRVERWLAEHRD